MGDTMPAAADHACLFQTASGQQGYFTAAQARACGFAWNLLTYHVGTGRFVRVHRGVYRLRDYPSFWRGEAVAAWLTAGKDRAVVSHESALDLLDLSDVIPNATHLTVPRSVRNLPKPPCVKIHTTTRPFRPLDLTWWEGVRVTSATRTILDAAEAGTQPDQIELAVWQTINRGMTTRTMLERDARERSRRVADLVIRTLEWQDQERLRERGPACLNER